MKYLQMMFSAFPLFLIFSSCSAVTKGNHVGHIQHAVKKRKRNTKTLLKALKVAILGGKWAL